MPLQVYNLQMLLVHQYANVIPQSCSGTISQKGSRNCFFRSLEVPKDPKGYVEFWSFQKPIL